MLYHLDLKNAVIIQQLFSEPRNWSWDPMIDLKESRNPRIGKLPQDLFPSHDALNPWM